MSRTAWKPLLASAISLGLLRGQTPYASSVKPAEVAVELPMNRGSAALWQSLKKLRTRASLIMITAHPDDEDAGMLTYASRGVGARVALLTLNRGEGGANVMSPDYFDALGLVRTQELLAADRYYGVDQYWTSVVDYGFSKTKDESYQQWTREKVLRDAVRVVRTVRPLVVTSVFVGGPSDGHGNHQVAGDMAQQVFQAAGDPNMFPEQIKQGLRPWKPIKVYARTPFFSRDPSAKLTTNIEVPEGDYDPLLGFNYVQIARMGYTQHTSQSGGIGVPAAGARNSAYHRFASLIPASEHEASFFDGIDTSLKGIAELAGSQPPGFLLQALQEITGSVEQALKSFSATEPEKSAPALAAGLTRTRSLIAQTAKSDLPAGAREDVLSELRVKEAQFNNALAESLGISLLAAEMPAVPQNPLYEMFMGPAETPRIAIPGQSLKVKVHLVAQGAANVQIKTVELKPADQKNWQVQTEQGASGTLDRNAAKDVVLSATVPQDAAFTRPYFTRANIEQTVYDVSEERYRNHPLADYPLAAWAELEYNGAAFSVAQLVQTVKKANGPGPVFEPLVVGPAISVLVSPRSGIVPLGSSSFPLTVTVQSNTKGPAEGKVRLRLPEGWKSIPEAASFATAKDGETQLVHFEVQPNNLQARPYQCVAVAEVAGKQYREGYHLTGYQGVRPYFLYEDAIYRTSGVDVKVAGKLRIGYITGSGDEVPESLTHLGLKAEYISAKDLASGDLQQYDTILLGVRTYAAREDLPIYNARLLDYVKNGGVVIVQYNTPEFDHNFGPYPYQMSNDPEEVTDEHSQVEILNPSNPIFQWPNRITAADFQGWVEERGSKFMKSWDPHYEALLETHDAGQPPQKGGLLYARYGKGVYVYNAYAFYRQLPEGVPGAYRLFANLVSLPKNPKAHGD